MQFYLILLITLSGFLTQAQTIEDTRLFDRSGTPLLIEELVATISEAQIVLFGELHGVSAAHELEKILANELYKLRGDKLILGGEMWEFDQQIMVNEYINSLITDKQFISDARLWPNFIRDYKTFIDVARTNKLNFVATNIPRRYASVVYYEGADALLAFDKSTRKQLPKLPFTFDADLPIYADIADQVGGHGSKHLAGAQAIKDATMAKYILDHTKKKNLFLHIHGEYHSKEFQGIYNYIKQEKGKWNTISISCVMQEDISTLEDDNFARADYIFVIKSEPKHDEKEERTERDSSGEDSTEKE